MKRILYIIYPILLGVATVFAFAPWHWFVLALFLPALLERRLIQHTPNQAALQGFLFGLGFFGLGISWVFFSIHNYSNAPLIIAIIITLSLIFAKSAFIALLAYVYRRLYPNPSNNTRLFVFPALWVLIEVFRGWFLTGFPWLYLGYAAIDTPLQGFAPIIGVYGLSWLCIFIGMSALCTISGNIKQRLLNGAMIILILILGFLLQQIHWTKPDGNHYSVALIQGNIEQSLKWEPEKFQQHFDTYFSMTQLANQADIIVWPEAALPVPLPYGQPYVDVLTESLLPNNTVVFGALRANNDGFFYNTVQVAGDGTGEYDKHHLVPFGEYIPFYNLIGKAMDLLKLPMSFALPGPRVQPPLQVHEWNVGALICYEIVYPSLSLTRAQDSAILLTISNDTWFGRSLGPLQHFQMSRMRALETGRYLIRATNNGISGIINPEGSVEAQAPQFVATTLTGSAEGMRGKTPLMWITHYAILLLMVAICAKNRYKTGTRKK